MTTVNATTIVCVCPQCNKEKPLTRKFWLPEIRENRKPFRTSACRLCMYIARREYCRQYAATKRNQDRETHNQYMREWKRKNRTTESRQNAKS